MDGIWDTHERKHFRVPKLSLKYINTVAHYLKNHILKYIGLYMYTYCRVLLGMELKICMAEGDGPTRFELEHFDIWWIKRVCELAQNWMGQLDHLQVTGKSCLDGTFTTAFVHTISGIWSYFVFSETKINARKHVNEIIGRWSLGWL